MIEVQEIKTLTEKKLAFTAFRDAMIGLGNPFIGEIALDPLYLESARTYGAFNSEGLIGGTDGYSTLIKLNEPQLLRFLAITHVGVVPEYQSEGVARALLTRQLADAKQAGYSVAGLRASDARIYGRYGFGIASKFIQQELDLTQIKPLNFLSNERVRRVEYTNTKLFKSIASQRSSDRPATVYRWDAWWAMQDFRLTASHDIRHAIVAGAPGDESGYLRFRINPNNSWFDSRQRTIIVEDFVAKDENTWRSLMSYLFRLKIVHRIVFENCAVDDALGLLIDNPRALKISGPYDELWGRILDIPLAIAASSLFRGLELVADIQDPLFPENSLTWKISGLTATKSSESADFRIGINDFTSLLFGAESAYALYRTQRLLTSDKSIVEKLCRNQSEKQKPHIGFLF